MGSFFANIHARVDGGLRRVADSIRDAILAADYREARDDESADRSVVIATTPSSDWIAIYDESSDWFDENAAEALGIGSSRGGTAILSMTADSDDATIALYREGTRIDRIDIPAGGSVRLNEAPWRILLGDRVGEFAQSVGSKSVFAEERIETLAKLLGWNPQFALAGYRTLDEVPQSDRIEMRFVLGNTAHFMRMPSSPPALSMTSDHQWPAHVGEERVIRNSFFNCGRPSQGVRVYITYSEEIESFLDIGDIRLIAGGARYEEWGEEADCDDRIRYIVAEFPDARFESKPEVLKKMTATEVKKYAGFVENAKVEVEFVVTPKKRGNTSVNIQVFPFENSEGGGQSTINLSID